MEAIPSAPTEAKTEAIAKWKKGDSKTHTRIELSLKNLEMIHLSGAITAKDMWKQLSMVKESKGCLGVLATQKALYWTMAPEGFDMIEHISKLRSYQDDLHIMENLVTNKDFVMILITSLPDSWDNFVRSFFSCTRNKPTIGSYKLILVFLHEDQRRKAQSGESSGTTLLSKGKDKQGAKKDKKCYNCKKKGHILLDCWAKSGGKGGQGPKGRKGAGKKNEANQAEEVNLSLNDTCYMARNSHEISKYD